MNLKKFISGVSALTIVASAFAGLAVTASAEATVTNVFTQDFTAIIPEGETEASTDPTDYGFTKVSDQGTTTVADGVIASAVGNNGSTRSAEYYAGFTAVGSGNEVTVSYTWTPGGANTATTYLADADGNKILTINWNGSGGTASKTGALYLNGGTDKILDSQSRNGSYSVTAKLDMTNRKVTALTIGSYSLSTALDFASEATSVARLGFTNSAKASSWLETSKLDDISISYKVFAGDITIKYVDNDDTTKEIATSKVISADGKYVGDTVTVPYPMYRLVDDTLYSRGRTSNKYSQDIAYTAASQPVQFRYTATEIDNVTFYSEAEDIEGVTKSNGSGNASGVPIRSSNAAAAYVSGDEDVTITTLQPGKYVIKGSMYSGNKDGGTLNFAVGDNQFSYSVLRDETSADSATANSTASTQYIYDTKNGAKTNNSNLLSSDEITVTTPTALVFKPSGGNTIALDYIYVVKTDVDPSAGNTLRAVSVTSNVDEDGVNAAAYTFDVTPGTNSAKTKVKVTVSGDNVETQSDEKPIGTVVDGEGSIRFGIILASDTKTAEELAALTVAIDFE